VDPLESEVFGSGLTIRPEIQTARLTREIQAARCSLSAVARVEVWRV
jgi:hypothetical protein